jgi:hypothetical protein
MRVDGEIAVSDLAFPVCYTAFARQVAALSGVLPRDPKSTVFSESAAASRATLAQRIKIEILGS